MQVTRNGTILRACNSVTRITRGIDIQAACAASEQACSPVADPGPVCEEEKVIDSIWRTQLHVRQHGAVVTRLNVNNPKALSEFFERNPRGVFNSTASCNNWPECGVPYGHAVLLVGYNNTATPPHWIVWTSWGPDFADGGTFRVAYGIAGVAGSAVAATRHTATATHRLPAAAAVPPAGIGNKPDTYGLYCQVADRTAQLARRLPLLPVRGGSRCYNYTVDAGRTPTWSAVAATFGVNIMRLVQSNRPHLVFKRHNETVLQTATLPGGAKACAQKRTCGSNGLPRGSALTCLLSVTVQRKAQQPPGGKQPAPLNCTLTWVRVDVSVQLKAGTQLMMCDVPVETFRGRGNGKLSGTAVAGAQIAATTCALPAMHAMLCGA